MRIKNAPAMLSVAGLVGAAVAAGLLAPGAFHGSRAAAAESTAAEPAASIPFGSAPNYRAIVAANRAAVVGVTFEGTQKADDEDASAGDGPSSEGPSSDDPFYRFFRGVPGHRQESRPVRGLGSGFIVRSDGVILTNAHVVRDAQRVTVTLADHREYRAKVVGLDTATDVAVLKIDARNLPVVHLGNAEQLQVGDYVLAIGAPYGLEETATAGIVSAKGRSLPDNSYVPFIQTDVAVNPGNSGGPLFDAHGNVVGINSQIYSNTGGYQGVSFAIPIEVALHDQEQIMKSGKVEHARLGVSVQPVTDALASSFNLPSPSGALVSTVDPDSAAARAGISPGDVILKFNGTAVTDAGSLSAQVGMSEPGQAATLEVWHEGKSVTMKATLGDASAGHAEVASASGEAHGKLGLAVHPITPEERSETNASSGLMVDQASGPAADAGIQSGDVVLSANGTPVSKVEELRSIVEQEKKVVALLIQRGDSKLFVPVQLG